MRKAVLHLKKSDPVMRKIIERVGAVQDAVRRAWVSKPGRGDCLSAAQRQGSGDDLSSVSPPSRGIR